MIRVIAVVCVLFLAGCSTVKTSSSPVEYKVGSIGPAGGFVFYDDAADGIDNLANARYLEAAPADLKGMYEWGPMGDWAFCDGSMIGAGSEFTKKFIAKYPDGKYAANACDTYRVNKYKDWFLPSREEASLMYSELKGKGLGGFSDGIYLSGGEDEQDYNEVIHFSTGNGDLSKKNTPHVVRPVRSF